MYSFLSLVQHKIATIRMVTVTWLFALDILIKHFCQNIFNEFQQYRS